MLTVVTTTKTNTWSESVSSDVLEPVGLEDAVAEELLAVLDRKHFWAFDF